MYLNKSKKGFGWYVTVKKDSKGNETDPCYLNFSFKKDCEPDNLSESGSYEGELYFIDKDNRKRKVFPYVDTYDNSVRFKILDWEYEDVVKVSPKHEENVENMGGDRSDSYQDIISHDDLPFY